MSIRTLLLIIFLGVITTILLWVAFTTQPQKQNTTISQKPLASLTPTPTPAKATLIFLPNSVSLSASQSASFDIQLDSAGNTVTSVQLEISYNPAVLTNVQVQAPEATKNLFSPIQLITLRNVDRKNGEISFGFTIPRAAKAQKQSGVIATVSFTANSPTQALSTLLFLPKTLVTQQGSNESILGDSLPATILIKGPLPTQSATASAN